MGERMTNDEDAKKAEREIQAKELRIALVAELIKKRNPGKPFDLIWEAAEMVVAEEGEDDPN